ncbi:MAG: phosphate ABC transporter permease subunit PstC [Oscillospiraceae bacterium]|nr:phosphate ABC transporter permease subunit PstC [Oscillospiraceae bacterium]
MEYIASPIELALSCGIASYSGIVEVNFVLKFCIWMYFLGITSSSIFLLIGKKKEVFFISVLNTFLSIAAIFLNNFFKVLKILDSNISIFFYFSSLLLVLSIYLIGEEYFYKIFFKSTAFLCIILMFLVIFYIAFLGFPAISEIGLKLFCNSNWSPKTNDFGILNFILCSLSAVVGVIIISVPIGILSAVFIEEFASKKLASLFKTLIKISAGIPSIVHGLFGMFVIVPTVGKFFPLYTTGDCLLSAILVLSIMILPTLVSISQDAINSVPKNLKEAAIALGEDKTKAIFKLVLPAAKKEIFTAVLLSIGRAIGETMAVIMVSGNAINNPGILKSSRFLTTAIALDISYASGMHRKVLFTCGFVLLLFMLIINFLFKFLFNKSYEK